jgi:hypothetical protein
VEPNNSTELIAEIANPVKWMNDAVHLIDALYKRFRVYFPKNAHNNLNEH